MNEFKKSVTPNPSSLSGKVMRKYDIVDLVTISIFNGLVFLSGLGVGWLIFFKFGVEV